jgi:hypothetical protein
VVSGERDFLKSCKVVTYESILVPLNTGLLVGVGVGVTLGGTGLTAEETVQVGADLVGTASLDSVALSATGLEMKLSVLSGAYVSRSYSPGRAWHPWRRHLEWKSR